MKTNLVKCQNIENGKNEILVSTSEGNSRISVSKQERLA